MAVTAITFDPRIDLPSGNLGAQPITLRATPTRIRENGTQTVYPETVTFTDVTGDSPFHLQSTDGTWAWTIGAYRRSKVVDIRTVFVTGATASWVDLVDVDPDTFLPIDPYTTVGQQLAALQSAISNVPTLTVVDSHISTAVNGLIDAAPSSLDTFKELADAIGNNPAFLTAITLAIASKSPLPATGTTPGYVATVGSDGHSIVYSPTSTSGNYDGGTTYDPVDAATYSLLAENGDVLTTEAGDVLTTV